MRIRLTVCILAALFCVGASAAEKTPVKPDLAAKTKAPAKPVVKTVAKAPAKPPAKNKVPAKKKPVIRPPQWAPSGKSAPLKIGWARCDVSTDLPVLIPGGWTRPVSQGMEDELTVTVLVIENGYDGAIFVSADHLGAGFGHMICNVARKLDKSVPTIDKWIVSATHTHSGVLIGGPGRHGVPAGVPFDEKAEYRKFFLETTAQAVVRAWRSRAPGKVAWGYGYVVGGFSRRTIYRSVLPPKTDKRENYPPPPVLVGHGTMHGPNTPEFSHYEAGMDPIANYLFNFDMNDKLTGAVINLSTTAQFGHVKPGYLSADFWYEARKALRKKFGDIDILPQCAAAGDITPGQQHYRAAQFRRLKLKYGDVSKDHITRWRLDIADRLTESFSEVQEWASKDKRRILPLAHTVITPELEFARYSDEDIAETKRRLAMVEALPPTEGMEPRERLREETYRATMRGKSGRIARTPEELQKKPTGPATLHVVRLGNIAFASNPFELFIDYMHRIQRQSPFEQTFIVQLSNMGGPHGGYLPTERAVANKGYSAEPYSYRTDPRGGATLVVETLKELKRLKELK